MIKLTLHKIEKGESADSPFSIAEIIYEDNDLSSLLLSSGNIFLTNASITSVLDGPLSKLGP